MEAPGTSTDETEGGTLAHDVHIVLLSYTRDRPDGGLLGRRLTEKEARALAEEIASALSVRLYGRYIPRWDDESRRRRNAGVLREFDGKNHREVMRKYGISRRLLYNILSTGRRRK